jgi:glutamate--cysteine ligase
VRDSKGRTEARFLESLEKQVERRATPANDALAKLGEAPGRGKEGRRALVEYFTFAGALPAPA